jgi:hypothetical protein
MTIDFVNYEFISWCDSTLQLTLAAPVEERSTKSETRAGTREGASPASVADGGLFPGIASRAQEYWSVF